MRDHISSTRHHSPRYLLCLLALTVFVVAVVAPFSGSRSRSSGISESLQFGDVLDQVNRGIFPVYVGQSEFVSDGTPCFQAPAYHITGVVFHFLTFGLCTPAIVQWLVAAYCVIGGLCAGYFGLGVVLSEQRWARLLGATLYVLGCGILLQLGFGDGLAFAAVPYVPLLLCMLLRAGRTPDVWTAGGTAGLLTLIWMSHAPTGLGATLLTGCVFLYWCCAGCWRQVTRLALVTTAFFSLLSVWYFTSAFTLGSLRMGSNWCMDQCALPVALALVAGALYLRYLLRTDRWEATFQFVRASGKVVHLGRWGWNAARAGAALSGVVLISAIVILVQRTPIIPLPGESVAVKTPTSSLRAFIRPTPTRSNQFESVRDPVLHNRVVHVSDGGHRVVVCNEEFVPIQGSAVPQPVHIHPGETALRIRDGRPFLHFRVEPNQRYLLTLVYWTKHYDGELHLDGDTIHQAVSLPEDTNGLWTVRLLVRAEGSEAQTVQVSLHGVFTTEVHDSGLDCASTGLTTYEPESLPIQIGSQSPYTVRVQATGDRDFLETNRVFVPGYKASVNGERAEVYQFHDGSVVVIPLRPGSNEVQLIYKGTTAMRVTFGLSTTSWLVLIVPFILKRLRREQTVTGRQPIVPEPVDAPRLAA